MTVYKTLSADDKVSTKTLLHEAIPITGTIVHRTYGTHPNEGNVQNFTHGMFQSVYDYPYLSSSANHIFDISCGFHATSSIYTAATSQKAKKNNVYNQMAQVLMGYDKDGKIQRFDEDGDISGGGTKIDDAIFLPFSRLLVKDEIKKGSFQLELGVKQAYAATTAVMGQRIKITDSGAATAYKVNSPAGEYGILVAETSFDGDSTLSTPLISGETISGQAVTSTKPPVGLLFYQAGVAVLSKNIFHSNHVFVTIKATGQASASQSLTIITVDGTSKTFQAAAITDGTAATATFKRTTASNGLDALKASIEESTIKDKVTVSAVQTVSGGFMITVTQNTEGTHTTPSHKTVTNNCANFSIAGNSAAAAGDFGGNVAAGLLNSTASTTQMNSTFQDFETMLKSSEISSSADAIRNRIYNLQFNNTIELNSTVYFCRAKHNEFNYSSNPTYLSGSQIRVKNETTDVPISYITSIGLYSADNELLAVGKFSEPVRKDNNIELTFRARLDY